MTHKPIFVIFYAWQSDRSASHNRYFIQEALTNAAERLNASPANSLNVRIDQDTQGEPGLCDIPATILRKIESADAFLCDLTYVAASQPEEDDDEEEFKARLCSNPNVLFELGYAFRVLGPERILCVMNEQYGPAADQIFDLAHRRFPMTYLLPNDSKSKKDVKEDLTKKLVEAISPLLILGKRSEKGSENKVAEIRANFETKVRQSNFHGLMRTKGALAISLISNFTGEISHEDMRQQNVGPPGSRGWNNSFRGQSVLSTDDRGGKVTSVTELRNDGMLFGAEIWSLDPEFHQEKDLLVPSQRIERVIIETVYNYLRTLKSLNAGFPWTVCISLLEVNGYYFLASRAHPVYV